MYLYMLILYILYIILLYNYLVGTDENINSSKFEEILKVLPKIPNLKAIEILSINTIINIIYCKIESDIIDPDLLEFDEYLKTNLKLEKLKIVSHKLSFLSFSSLLTNINPHIKELSLSSDLYNDAVTLILNNHIPKLPDLERLELYGYKLSANELEKVYVNVEAYCPNMKYLALPCIYINIILILFIINSIYYYRCKIIKK